MVLLEEMRGIWRIDDKNSSTDDYGNKIEYTKCIIKIILSLIFIISGYISFYINLNKNCI